MILSVDIAEKSFGNNVLYQDLHFEVQDGEKVGLIGRNGCGKTTLLAIMTSEDTDYDGEVRLKKGVVLIGSRQEHHGYESKTVLEYILDDLPEYASLKHIIETYPQTMGSHAGKIQTYSDALERFNHLGYFEVEGQISDALAAYQISHDQANRPIASLSGGQKRLAELVKVQRARAHLALIDEPTNHMDYIAKQAFIKWFKAAREAVVVISHDRDVLQAVDRIIEIKDGQAISFPGNYDDYLRINATKTVSQVNEFGIVQRRIANLRENIIRFQRLKERSRDPGTIRRFKSQEMQARAQLAELETKAAPSFWIDRDSAQDLNEKIATAYQKHKARNIKIKTNLTDQTDNRLLIDAKNVSLGYGDTPLFVPVSFQLREGDRLRLHGRNGAGKSTLLHTIVAKAQAQQPAAKLLQGTIAVEPELKIGIYEQEISAKYLPLSLTQAIEQAYMAKNVPVGETKVKQLLSDYLFNPMTDGDVPLARLSGGQKARFQLMNMLAGHPQVLILDEPTNHLDLPSIEELEDALTNYSGAIIYISHDSYFAGHLPGQIVQLDSMTSA